MSSQPSLHFLGISDAVASYRMARVAVQPVPYEATVSYGGGTARGPAAIIEASAQVELYDEELGCEPFAVGVSTLNPLAVEGLAPAQMSSAVEQAVARIIADGKMPLMLGGEHSITPPAVRAAARAARGLTVVQFDAHADLRQEYHGDPMSHACAMARVRDICPAVQIGIRNLSSEEAAWVERDALEVFFAKDLHADSRWMGKALGAIHTDDVYITIDIDALDSSSMPATGTPEPGGMTWYQLTGFLRKVMTEKRVVGCDIVELAPIAGFHAYDFLAAKLAYKCIGYWMRGEGITAASVQTSSPANA